MLKRVLLALLIMFMAGPAVTQAPPTHIENKVVAEGDSISVYWVGNYTGIYDASRPAVTVTGLAVSGSGITAVTSRVSQVYAADGEVVTLLIGANDLYSVNHTTPIWLAKVWAYTDDLRARGYKVAMGTVLPRCDPGNVAFYTEFNRRRNFEANPAIRAAVGVHIDAVIDYAADPVMGPDSAACNTALYDAGLHPTDGNGAHTGGQDKLAAIYTPVVDALLLSPSQTPPPHTFVQPPDVPNWGDTNVNMYAAGTTLNKLGNGIDPDGGTPPAAAYELPDIPVSPVGWANQSPQGPANFCSLTAFGGTCVQAKARFNANITHILFDDPIRNYGQPGTSHCHEFFGNGSANAFSTFARLRGNATRYSAATGGPLNGTAYWFPCIIKPNAFGDSKDYVVRPDFAIFYYTAPSVPATAEMTYLLQGLRYVSGFNMDDGVSSGEKLGGWLQDKIDAANAQPGTSPTRYSIYHSGSNGVIWNWVCGGQTVSYRLAVAAGTDPFSGHCPAGSQLILQFSGAGCWDGINFWSPGGYKHVVPKIWDNVAAQFICPNGWYSLPVLQIELSFTHNGPSDYTKWVCASDPVGSDHCSTFHTDWMNGWDRTTLHSWMDNCIGVNGTPHECNDSTVGPNLRMYRGETGATGRSPQVNISSGTFNTTDPTKMWLLPDSSHGPKTIHMHGG